MATYTLTGTSGTGIADALGSVVTPVTISPFLTRTGLSFASGGIPLANADLAKVWLVPAKTLVLGAIIRVISVSGSATTVTGTLGDSASTTQWLAASSFLTATTTTATAYISTATPKYYEVADYIAMTMVVSGGSAVITQGQVEVTLITMQLPNI